MSQSVAEVIAGDQYTTTPAYEYPEGLGTGEYPHFILFTARRAYTSTTGQGVSGGSTTNLRGTPVGSVALYMPPDALKTSYTQSYGDVDMGASIGIAMSSKDYAAAGEGLLGADLSGAMDLVAGVGLSSMKDAAVKAVADKVKGTVTSGAAGDVAQAIERASGRIMNPHKAVIYQGPGGFRTFSYSFSMVATSPTEARTIRNIVQFFKVHMHPGVGGGGGDINHISSHTLTYPNEFSIRYTVNRTKSPADQDDYKSLFRIHTCFLESFSADYTTSSLPVFIDDDGEPQTTTISMSFKETQLLTKDDIRAGF